MADRRLTPLQAILALTAITSFPGPSRPAFDPLPPDDVPLPPAPRPNPATRSMERIYGRRRAKGKRRG